MNADIKDVREEDVVDAVQDATILEHDFGRERIREVRKRHAESA